jgi:hypothetical protein
MSKQGTELLDSIRSMRDFLGDVSQLFVTADGLMSANSWEPLWGSGCLAEMSYHVSLGHKWMPREAVRPYTNKDNFAGIVTVISVLLDDFQREYKLEEPVIAASYFAFPEEKAKEGLKLDFWQGRCFGWCKLAPDGTHGSVDKDKPEWKETYGWKQMEVFGQPLVEITSETLLKEKIIDPLLHMIKAYQEMNSIRNVSSEGE